MGSSQRFYVMLDQPGFSKERNITSPVTFKGCLTCERHKITHYAKVHFSFAAIERRALNQNNRHVTALNLNRHQPLDNIGIADGYQFINPLRRDRNFFLPIKEPAVFLRNAPCKIFGHRKYIPSKTFAGDHILNRIGQLVYFKIQQAFSPLSHNSLVSVIGN